MEESQIKYNEHLVKITENALAQLLEGMTVLIQSQRQLMEKVTKHIQSSTEDNLEITSQLDDIEEKLDSLTKAVDYQEEEAEEIKIDIEEIKNYVVLVNAVKERK